MTTSDLQIKIFHYLKTKIPEHISLVDELAGLLNISTDSAYRRIRGEKPMSIEETYKICVRFNLSLDALLNIQSDAFLFQGNFVNGSNFKFDEYLHGVVQQVKYMNSFKQKKMYYLCKDIPLFHHFHCKEIAAFKYYFWLRTILQAPHFNNKKFVLADYPDDLFAIGKQALEYYNQLDSTEIWNIESINSTIRQIEYYHDSGMFYKDEDILILYNALEKLIKHLEMQADKGYKFSIDEPDSAQKGAFEMYFNEVILGDNSILAVLDESKITFLLHSMINILHTRDIRFCNNMYQYVQNLVKKSTLISSVSEKERASFFKYLNQRILKRKEKLNI